MTMRYHLTPLGWLYKKQKVRTVGEDVEKTGALVYCCWEGIAAEESSSKN